MINRDMYDVVEVPTNTSVQSMISNVQHASSELVNLGNGLAISRTPLPTATPVPTAPVPTTSVSTTPVQLVLNHSQLASFGVRNSASGAVNDADSVESRDDETDDMAVDSGGNGDDVVIEQVSVVSIDSNEPAPLTSSNSESAPARKQLLVTSRRMSSVDVSSQKTVVEKDSACTMPEDNAPS